MREGDKVLGVHIVLAMTLLVGCTPAVRCVDPKEKDPRDFPYELGAEDLLMVTVWDQPNLTGPLRVRPDGRITMALVGDVQAADRTAEDVAKDIATGLARYLKAQPSVTIAVTEAASYKYSVSGNVERPGVFTSRAYVTVSDAVAQAGGLNRFGKPLITILRRDKKGATRRIKIDLRAIQSGNCPAMDIYLWRGDQLLVP
jgi:polysaccharide export outer membrane protein